MTSVRLDRSPDADPPLSRCPVPAGCAHAPSPTTASRIIATLIADTPMERILRCASTYQLALGAECPSSVRIVLPDDIGIEDEQNDHEGQSDDEEGEQQLLIPETRG